MLPSSFKTTLWTARDFESFAQVDRSFRPDDVFHLTYNTSVNHIARLTSSPFFLHYTLTFELFACQTHELARRQGLL